MIKPNQPDNDGHIVLDARVSRKKGIELRDEIIESVAATQRFILQPLPDVLLLTQKQFMSLQDYTDAMYQTEDRMFVTPKNVMEVRIDREIDTDQDVESVMVEVDKLKQEIHDHEPDTDTDDHRGRPDDTHPPAP